MKEIIKNKLELLPDLPGSYQMYDENHHIIYVGKAKNLKNRVRSYFTGAHNKKTQNLVADIADFEYIVTSSNKEALLLEINLIKKHRPKYNILLKDDKTYPYIEITKEKYPRLLITRQVNKKEGIYFGPYPDVYAANETKKLLDRLYPLRKCRVLPNKVCLYYHMGQCLAPCVFNIDPAVYQKMVSEIKSFLNGGYHEIQDRIKSEMETAADNLEFERAQELRDQLRAISSVMIKQKITSIEDDQDRDVFGYVVDKGWIGVSVLYVRTGKIIKRDVSIFPSYNDPEDDFLTFFSQFYDGKEHLFPKEILLPTDIDADTAQMVLHKNVKIANPQRGKKRGLVLMAEKNASIELFEKFKLREKKEQKSSGAIEELGDALNIPTPHRIEIFDNSNIQGADPVSAMVVYVEGLPAKKEYRKYKIKTVIGPDDYSSMREVIYRRYSRVVRDNLQFPDLIIVDGGKGQINAAKDVLDNQLGLDIPIAGLAKDDKHNTSELIFRIGDDDQIIHLDRRSEAFFLLQRMQEEVHRFVITFFKKTHQKNSLASILENVEGLGPKRRKMLMVKYKSITAISNASVEELHQAGLPEKVAKDLKAYLNKE
ncbi:excinuclease ABC subunit UvrC [Xylocopilactobacillus apis]|uniref:UvrABC system protein C n=1 Tax=Xylocopilactobacillus apis TaxID=2932183 RepID=A0AAU9D5J4_9LACO|nr:excinuclease ABC subunit UvrC [Xylocopilactobacillus apis]BDR56680.1 UvrABC system protein C [Xylocopilactobacillus apis]